MVNKNKQIQTTNLSFLESSGVLMFQDEHRRSYLFIHRICKKCYNHSARSAFSIVQRVLSKMNKIENSSIHEKKPLLIVKFFVSRLNTTSIYVSYTFFVK